MTNTLRLSTIIMAVLFLTANTFASAKTKSTSVKSTAAKAITAIASSDTSPGSYEVQVITSDDDFALMRCSSQTKITNGKRLASVADIKRGTKLICKGKWVNDKPKWFKVDSIEVRGVVSESEVMSRVGAACQKIAKNGASSRQLSGSYNAEPARSASSTSSYSEDIPKTVLSQKSDEAEEPQLKITDTGDYRICVRGNPSAGGYADITVEVKNLTNRTITGLAATADLFSSDGEYVCSSKSYYGWNGDGRVGPGERCMIQIKMFSYGDEWPSVSGFKLRFTSRNLGDLTLSDTDGAMISLSDPRWK